MKQELTIDPEFQSLIPPLSADELAQLEANIIAEGCRDPLVVWGNILIDGHNRYAICTKNNLEFQVVNREFESRNDALRWVILNQFGRRNLSAYDRARLALKLKPVIAEKAREKQACGQGGILLPKKSWEASQSLEVEIQAIKNQDFSPEAERNLISDAKIRAGKETQRQHKTETKCVYVAKSVNGIKIGISSDPEARIEQLKTGNPDIELVKKFNCGEKSWKIEALAHKKFADFRINNEWFKAEIQDDALRFISREFARMSETGYQVAEAAGVSMDTLAKVEKIEQKAPEAVKAALASGEISINQAHQQIVKEEKIAKRAEMIAEQKRAIESGAVELPPGVFEVVAMDPPWNYGREYDPDGSRVANPYPEMTQAQLLELKPPFADDCVLFLWTTQAFLWDAKDLLDKWGFTYKATLVWDKEKIGMGAWLRMQCEFCLVGIKGKPSWNNTRWRDIIREPRREHSRKPDAFYEMVEDITIGRRLEFFSREKRNGWEVFGNDVEKF